MPMSSLPPTDRATRSPALPLALACTAVLALAAHRASVGQSFYDDTFYAVVPWRFAHGARFLLDELSLQTIGSMIATPFAWTWERLFGTTGIVLAIRLLWVALAAAGAALCARLVRDLATPGVVVLAVAIPLLAPPYHVFAPTYNTVSSLLLTLSVLFAFAALRHRREWLAAASGASVALAAAAYPPLAVAGLMLLAAFAMRARSTRLALTSALSAAAVGLAACAALLSPVPFSQLTQALAFGSANVASFSTPFAKMQWVFGNTAAALVSPWLTAMWIAAALASVPRIPVRVRVIALTLLPVGAALPGAILLARGEQLSFGTSAASWLVTFCAGALVPSTLALVRLGKQDLVRLLVLAAPVSAVGYVTVAYVTNSSWNRAMPAIALAPLAVGIFLGWGSAIREEAGEVFGRRAFAAASVVAVTVVFSVLYANPFMDGPLTRPLVRVSDGPYAGLLTSVAHRDAIAEIQERAPKWVGRNSRVTFLGQAEAYLLTGGQPHTPASWLYLGKGDSAAIDYFRRVGRAPDVVFVSDSDVHFAGGWSKAPASDPMLRWVLERYRRVDSAGGFGVFVLREPGSLP